VEAILLALSNRALVADGVSPTDVEAAQASLQGLHCRLSLGLEYLCEGSLERSFNVLKQVALLRVARLGYSLPLDVRKETVLLARQSQLGRGAGKTDLLDAPFRQQISGLLGVRPHFFDAAANNVRPFQRLEDLHCATTWCTKAKTIADFMKSHPLPAPLPEEVTYGDLFRTHLINALLDRPAIAPIDEQSLQGFLTQYIVDGKLGHHTQRILDSIPHLFAVLPKNGLMLWNVCCPP